MKLTYFLFFATSLTLFFAGLPVLTTCLQALAGTRLNTFLLRAVRTLPRAFFAGFLITAAVNSSSAVTVFCIGLADSGILKPKQLAAVIMGSNIGTTCTAHLLWMSNQAASTTALSWLAPGRLGPLLMLTGLLLSLPFQHRRIQIIGGVLLGLGMIFAGLAGMELALAPLGNHPSVLTLFSKLSHPVTGLLAGTAVTTLLQSSSTSVGLLQAFAATGTISFPAAVAMICGQNIGTCSTACLAAVNGGEHARFVARFHLYFNLLGALGFLALFHLAQPFFPASTQIFLPDPKDIALIHTVFNVFSTLVLLPFFNQLIHLSAHSFRLSLRRAKKRNP